MGRQGIKIVTWNANGLQKSREELQIFLDTQKIDIAIISETHLTKQSHIKFRGYNTTLFIPVTLQEEEAQ